MLLYYDVPGDRGDYCGINQNDRDIMTRLLKIKLATNENHSTLEFQGWFGTPGRPRWRQDAPRCELGRALGQIWKRIGGHLGAKMGKVGAKMALCGPTWGLRWPPLGNNQLYCRRLTFYWKSTIQNAPIVKLISF